MSSFPLDRVLLSCPYTIATTHLVVRVSRACCPEALKRETHACEHYLAQFYTRLYSTFSCTAWVTERVSVEVGVAQGDTLSPILFLMVMQLLLDSLTKRCPSFGYRPPDGSQKHLLKAFADDLTLICRDEKQLANALSHLLQLLAPLGLELKPSKCRVLGLVSGKAKKLTVPIMGEVLLNVSEAPTKFLGMNLGVSQTPKEKAAFVGSAILAVIQALDDFPLPDVDKVQLYKGFAIPRFRWTLTVHEVLPTALTNINQKVEGFLKKWWKLPRSTSRDALRQATGLQSLQDIFEAAQLTRFQLARASGDPAVKRAFSAQFGKRKTPWAQFRALASVVATHAEREGEKARLKRAQVVTLASRVSKLAVQGAWSLLHKEEDADRMWHSMIWGLPSHITRFATQAALDILPTHANLSRWRAPVGAACACGLRDTLAHALNGCELKLPRFKWRHDSILVQIAAALLSKGHSPHVDLPGMHRPLPPFLTDQALRPDIVLISGTKMDFLELTVPFESNFGDAHLRKTKKYTHLMGLAKEHGFVPHLYCFEVGSRGLTCDSWSFFTKKFGLRPLHKNALLTALRCSYVIWTTRFLPWEDPPFLSLEIGGGDYNAHDTLF